MNSEQIKQIITTHIKGASVTVIGGDGKFEVKVISERFHNLDTVSRHRLVYSAVNQKISSGVIHALSLQTHTPEEVSS